MEEIDLKKDFDVLVVDNDLKKDFDVLVVDNDLEEDFDVPVDNNEIYLMKKKEICIPLELITDILSRLPVKAVFRFRCVSTLWSPLMYQPHFPSMFYENTLKQPSFLITHVHLLHGQRRCRGSIHFTCVDQEFNVQKTFAREISECLDKRPTLALDGLVCFNGQTVYICNPTIGEFFPLPQYFPPTRKTHFHGLPRFPSIGFGRSSLTHQYKVVRFFHDDKLGNEVGWQVYTIGKDSTWRQLNDFHYTVFDSYAPYLHGSLHWVIDKNLTLGNQGKHILGFKLEEEEFFLIHYPNYIHSRLVLLELKGYLCTAELDRVHCGRLRMWMLKDYKSQKWVKHCTINISPFCKFPPKRIIPRFIRDDGAMLLQIQDMGLAWYDPNTRMFDQVAGISADEEYSGSFSVTPYNASLYSLKSIAESIKSHPGEGTQELPSRQSLFGSRLKYLSFLICCFGILWGVDSHQ